MKKTYSFLIWRGAIIRSLYVILLVVIWGVPTFGQNIAISGVVKSQRDREFLPGVSIIIKGTDRGTITDANGKYSLVDVPRDGVLVFSFVGMKRTEIKVDGRRKIDVTMEEEAIGLDEVVAVGYGSVKRKDVTGAISSVSADEITRTQPVTIEQSLQEGFRGWW